MVKCAQVAGEATLKVEVLAFEAMTGSTAPEEKSLPVAFAAAEGNIQVTAYANLLCMPASPSFCPSAHLDHCFKHKPCLERVPALQRIALPPGTLVQSYMLVAKTQHVLCRNRKLMRQWRRAGVLSRKGLAQL